jgi:selenoprotein W-related protein
MKAYALLCKVLISAMTKRLRERDFHDPGSIVMNTETPPLHRPRVAIHYCTQCNWLLRSAWMAQELLQTFGQALSEVALIPDTGGRFEIAVDETVIWERKRDGGFPGPKELKQRMRDAIDPERDLGHVDR